MLVDRHGFTGYGGLVDLACATNYHTIRRDEGIRRNTKYIAFVNEFRRNRRDGAISFDKLNGIGL